ncbi:MAG TPA: hypothetical protein VKS60_11860 [Stellaceae bacterium]|nr:hypothetical protein [Stellaceae bacterium]
MSELTTEPVSVFTVVVAGIPVCAFAADTLAEAQAEAVDPNGPFADSLQVLRWEGKPSSIAPANTDVRGATPDEEQLWRTSWEDAVATGDADPAAIDDWTVYLVDVKDPTDRGE